MEDSIRDCEEEEMVTVAEEARDAAATPKPMPDVPPNMTMFLPASLLYLSEAMLMIKSSLNEFRVEVFEVFLVKVKATLYNL